MLAFVVRRLLGMAVVLFLVSVIVFAIFIVLPGGDPAVRMAGRNPTDQNIANIRATWGFDDNVAVQYLHLMERTFNSLRPGIDDPEIELVSYSRRQNVVDQIVDGLPATFSLAIGAAAIWLVLGVLAGVISAVRAGRRSDRAITVLALVGISLPGFWLALVARYYLGPENAGLFPDGQYVGLTESPFGWAHHLLLPWLVLALLSIGFYARVLRSNVLDAIGEDYVRTARAKGLAPRRVLARHVLRNSLIPVVTLFGLDFAALVGGGAILIESVFELHGVGQYAAGAIGSLDLPPIMGVTLLGACFIVLFNTVVDVLYAYLDPRIRPA
jgi:peptide/nickel transport system permease protein